MVKTGLNGALRQPFAVTGLFVYELLWGFFMYRYIQSIVTPLLHRYPGAGVPSSAGHLFFAEGQFRLMKTELIVPYLWTLAGLLAVRMIVSPLLNAAVYYSLHRTDLNAGYRFFKGIKALGGVYSLYYAILLAFSVAPLPWIFGKANALFEKNYLSGELLTALLPYAAGYLIYIFLLKLLFMYVQFGKAAGIRIMPTLLCWAGNLHRAIIIAVLVSFAFLLLTAIVFTISYIWAGLTALILYQLYPLFRIFMKVWSISSQYEQWRVKVNA
jgi:hypothetical protein